MQLLRIAWPRPRSRRPGALAARGRRSAGECGAGPSYCLAVLITCPLIIRTPFLPAFGPFPTGAGAKRAKLATEPGPRYDLYRKFEPTRHGDGIRALPGGAGHCGPPTPATDMFLQRPLLWLRCLRVGPLPPPDRHGGVPSPGTSPRARCRPVAARGGAGHLSRVFDDGSVAQPSEWAGVWRGPLAEAGSSKGAEAAEAVARQRAAGKIELAGDGRLGGGAGRPA